MALKVLPQAMAGDPERRDRFEHETRRFPEGHSYAEVARRTGYAPQEVKSYLQKGKRNLKILLTTRSG